MFGSAYLSWESIVKHKSYSHRILLRIDSDSRVQSQLYMDCTFNLSCGVWTNVWMLAGHMKWTMHFLCLPLLAHPEWWYFDQCASLQQWNKLQTSNQKSSQTPWHGTWYSDPWLWLASTWSHPLGLYSQCTQVAHLYLLHDVRGDNISQLHRFPWSQNPTKQSTK